MRQLPLDPVHHERRVGDSKVVEQKVSALADRVVALNDVDLFGGDAEITGSHGVFSGG